MLVALPAQPTTGPVGLRVHKSVLSALPYVEEWLTPYKSDRLLPTQLELDFDMESGLVLSWHQSQQRKPMLFHIDFEPTFNSLRSFPAPKQGAFNQALGKKTKVVFDATGGWGNDAMLMATQGYQVFVQERHPLMATLLCEAFARLNRVAERSGSALMVPSVKMSDSLPVESLINSPASVDCVYLDPMFPPKRKKSAAANKQMQLLQWLIGEDVDANELLSAALTSGAPRVAVKRPDYAQPLLKEPVQKFSSKLVHYDVYLA